MFRRIVVPLWRPEMDEKLLQVVEREALAHGAEIVLLRVAHYHTRDARVHEIEEAEEYLGQVAERLRARGIRVQTVVRHGEPAEQIVAYANESGADLVAMATHGHSQLRHLFLGSIAEDVLRGINIPLLLIKP